MRGYYQAGNCSAGRSIGFLDRRRRIGRFVLSLAALFFLAGCVPDVEPKEVPLKSGALGLGASAAPRFEDQWWRAFGDPGLDRAVAEGLQANPTLAEALARLRVSEAAVETARSQQFPQVTFVTEEQRTQFSSRYVIPPPVGGSTQWIGTFGADLSWYLDFWGREAALVGKARALSAASQLDSDGAHLAIAGAIVDAYVQLDAAYKLADLASQNLDERRQIFDLTSRRVAANLDSIVEERQAQTLYEQAQVAQEQANADRDVALHALAALMGRGADVYAQIGRPSLKETKSLELPAALPADLLARRPDVLAAEWRVDAASEGRSAARTAFYPNVNLLASAGWAAIGFGNLFTSQAQQYGGGAAIDLPIFDAGKRQGDYSAATAELDAAVADYNATLVGAVKETADGVTRVESLAKESVAQAGALSDAETAFTLATTRYRSGLTNHVTLLVAEALVIQARREKVAIDAANMEERVKLVVALGGGFSPGEALPPPVAQSGGENHHE
jgi:NodT family efflux transporter outer membrane factor (OMF) lipoprotein